MKPWIKYSIARLLAFALLLAILLTAGVNWALATVVAALAALAISYIFFAKLRDAVALDLVRRRQSGVAVRSRDDRAEDEEFDGPF